MKKLSLIIMAITTTVLISGCAPNRVKVYCKGKSDNSWECGGEAEWEIASTFRPVMNLLASAGVFTYEDWVGLDVENFTIKLDESSSTTTLNNNRVEVKILSSGATIGTREFNVYKTGDSYRFSNPSSVKSWSQNFVDSADEFRIDFATSSTGVQGATTTLSMEENGETLEGSSVTFQSVPYTGGGGPGEWMEK